MHRLLLLWLLLFFIIIIIIMLLLLMGCVCCCCGFRSHCWFGWDGFACQLKVEVGAAIALHAACTTNYRLYLLLPKELLPKRGVAAVGTQSSSVNLTPGRILDVRLGEAHAQMVRFGQLMIVHFDQCQHSLLHRRQLQQCHLAVLAVNQNEFSILISLSQSQFHCLLTGKIWMLWLRNYWRWRLLWCHPQCRMSCGGDKTRTCAKLTAIDLNWHAVCRL